MDLLMTANVERYHSQAQISRVRTETWTLENGYCPRCGNGKLVHERNNEPVADFICPACGAVFEQKGKNGKFSKSATASNYQKMIDQIITGTNPDIFFLTYDRNRWLVTNLFVVPKHFFHPDMIQCRPPLKATARRAGWVGCTIRLNAIPEEGRIFIIKSGVPVEKSRVLQQFQKTLFLADQTIKTRGWLLDILQCVNRMPTQFSLDDIYECESELQIRHPANSHVRDKIRQQLQLLRDHGIIRFLKRGLYEKTTGA